MEKIAQLFRVFWSPRKTLHELAQRPSVIAPLVLLTIFAGLETAIVFSTLDPGELRLEEFKRGGYADKISDGDKVIHAQAARNNRGFAIAVTTLQTITKVLAVAGVFFLCLGVGKGIGFKPFLSVTAFAFIPGILHSIVTILVIMTAARTPENLLMAGSVSPVRFLSATSVSPTIYMMLSTIDAVSLWILVLLIVGYGFLLRNRVGLVPRVLVVGGAYCLWSIAFVSAVFYSGLVAR